MDFLDIVGLHSDCVVDLCSFKERFCLGASVQSGLSTYVYFSQTDDSRDEARVYLDCVYTPT